MDQSIHITTMEKTKLGLSQDLILTAGPHIDYREVNYAADAALNGWNHHHSDYLRDFENLFKKYIGVDHGFATSSCTGALHLALLAKGIGPGDEVLVPETSWIATAAAVVYTGATPVFCDIEADSWVMDSSKLEKHITARTKAIIPVHLYGQPVVMEPIWDLAAKHNLFILEDGAPSIGTIYKGKKTGNLGHAAAFSFQGAKAVVTGEGGFLVTNDEELKKQAWFINDHGRDPNKALYNLAIGYKYKMSNVQAAIGLAQMQKVEEIVAQKRQIFAWYQERLGDIDELSLNIERPETRNIYWMSSIVLGQQIKFSRDEFMLKLKERMIDSRPMFYPMSSFPMFNKAENPVAYSVPMRGINLPSGHARTEEEIDYVCAHIRDLLGSGIGKCANIQPHGYLAFKKQTETKIANWKKDPGLEIEIPQGYLSPVTTESLNNQADIKLLAKWREAAQDAFPAQFKVTEDGTKRWLENGVLKTTDRVLFWVHNKQGQRIGHVGLFRFDLSQKFCELDNIVRGESGSPGIMQEACQALIDLCKEELELKDIYLRVFSNNPKALKLYENLGMREIQRSALRKIEEDGAIKWIEVIKSPYETIERYFITYKL
ncbi:MAG: GNAT family N-acetyltransferase [Cyanobacteria bacterium]|nr:GNAT family N-acetyltransferase [Cyanobacteriota bacterium]MDA1020132.1 GNAT family N-acetyltransferase [Cyanobacteriota bacterium]